MEVHLWTDGAVKNNGGPGKIGMAVVAVHVDAPQGTGTREFAWGEECERATNILAELTAIHRGLALVAPGKRARTHLVIWTDSEWSIKRIRGVYPKADRYPELVDACRALLCEYASHRFEQVRGHAGIARNERANDLAQWQAGSWRKKTPPAGCP